MTRASCCCLVVLALACGPSPGAASAEGPSGTLVIVIRQGPDRVPFRPHEARIQQANRQLAEILGHSIQIEVDGALLPQTREASEEVLAYLVEEIARDLDALKKERAEALAFARDHFERIVVRYAPTEAAAREDRWRRMTAAKLDPAAKTIDVVRAEASWRALERGEVASVLLRGFEATETDRYGRAAPEQLPPGELRAWFDYHAHGHGDGDESEKVGTIDGRVVLGMITVHRRALDGRDAGLANDAKKWLVGSVGDWSSAYHHHAAEVEAAAPGSSYRRAETAYVAWLKTALPELSLEERGKIAQHLWVTDFRKDSGERDRFARYAFPGLDPMAFSFDAVDAWIRAGHPPVGAAHGEPPARDVPVLYDTVIGPAYVETNRDGQLHFQDVGRGDGTFYRWALVDRAREEAFVKGLVARPDEPFAIAAFLGARRALREESDYLRFLRRFEGTPALWRVGAEVHREVVYRPSALLLDESRRLWRDAPFARGHVLFWFARQADGSYHPESDWPDMIQGTAADEAAFRAFLDLGWEAFELLPPAWPGVARKSFRVPVIVAHAKPLLRQGIRARPGGRGVSGTLAAVAQLLCDEHATAELAELGAFARTELAANPGAGLSDVVAATDPRKCVPRPAPRPRPVKKPPRPPPPRLKEGDFF